MPYTDLLRVTVLLCAAPRRRRSGRSRPSRPAATTTRPILIVGAAWWLAGDRSSASTSGRPDARRRRRARRARPARTATSLPAETPQRIALGRLWPIGLTAIVAGALGIFFPGVAAIGAGYALLVALAWRTREAAVLGIEERDGVRFYVVPGSALRPIELVRTPGLGRDRVAPGHPPPPPPAV